MACDLPITMFSMMGLRLRTPMEKERVQFFVTTRIKATLYNAFSSCFIGLYHELIQNRTFGDD